MLPGLRRSPPFALRAVQHGVWQESLPLIQCSRYLRHPAFPNRRRGIRVPLGGCVVRSMCWPDRLPRPLLAGPDSPSTVAAAAGFPAACLRFNRLTGEGDQYIPLRSRTVPSLLTGDVALTERFDYVSGRGVRERQHRGGTIPQWRRRLCSAPGLVLGAVECARATG